MNTQDYLQKYYKIQNKILLVSRLTKDSHWGYKAFYLSPEYNPIKEYNHRSMLDCELVFEWDLDNKAQNKKNVDTIAQRLSQDGIEYAKFDSGNKSTHLHVFLDIKSARNLSLLKRQFIKYYCAGITLPDLQLCTTNHLIRCEEGLNEKTGRRKKLLSKSKNYPRVCKFPQKIWDMYIAEQERISKMLLTRKVNDLHNSEAIKFIMDTKNFSKVKDGRKRGLFILIWTLKNVTDKEALKSLLVNWYKYSGGQEYTEKDIIKYIDYYEKKDYSQAFLIEYINNLLIDLGEPKLCIGNLA